VSLAMSAQVPQVSFWKRGRHGVMGRVSIWGSMELEPNHILCSAYLCVYNL
jgi:hypothetical protein